MQPRLSSHHGLQQHRRREQPARRTSRGTSSQTLPGLPAVGVSADGARDEACSASPRAYRHQRARLAARGREMTRPRMTTTALIAVTDLDELCVDTMQCCRSTRGAQRGEDVRKEGPNEHHHARQPPPPRIERGGRQRLARSDPSIPGRERRAHADDRRGLSARGDRQPVDLREGHPRLDRLRRRARELRGGAARRAGNLRADRDPRRAGRSGRAGRRPP